MRSDVAMVPGWYGKLPTLGDFASRRLADDFVEPWDLWLAGAQQSHRGALGERWLASYLQTPPWRFLLTPGVIAGAAAGTVFAGVLVPSVDRVGRHFPLTLAASLPAVPTTVADIEALLGWLHRLEDTALDAVQNGWGIDDLESALASLAPPRPGAVSADDDRMAALRRALASAEAGGSGFVDIGAGTSRADLAGVFAGALGAAPVAALGPAGSRAKPLDRVAVFIADVPGRPQLLVSLGLPHDRDFARMFGGSGSSDSGSGSAIAPSASSPTSIPIGTAAAAATRTATATATATPSEASTTDVLALFDAEATLPPQRLAPYTLPPDEDIFALLDAGSTPAAAAPAGAPAPAPDDILAMFAVPGEAAAATRAADGEPDILDLFGGSGAGKPT